MRLDIKSPILLVLDLDETLIHAVKNPIINQGADFTVDQYFVYKRPSLDFFLTEVAKHFRLGIWSSASDQYVEEVAKLIVPASVSLEFVWGRSKCTSKLNRVYDTFYFEKKLSKLRTKGFLLEQILIVDDTAEKVSVNYGNAIYIKEFTGDLADKELSSLLPYLISLKDVENVRTLEKRSWRSNY